MGPVTDWPAGVDVLLLPEEIDWESLPEQISSQVLHASEQVDIRKAFRSGGYSCEFASDEGRRAEISRKSDDLWLGIIMVTANAIASGAGNLLAEYIRIRLGADRLKRTRIHAKITEIKTDDMSIRTFESEGMSGSEWLAALDKFITDTNDDA